MIVSFWKIVYGLYSEYTAEQILQNFKNFDIFHHKHNAVELFPLVRQETFKLNLQEILVFENKNNDPVI